MECDKKRFFDTSSLLELTENDFNIPFVISSKSLEEIENIKTSLNKSDEIKFKARNVSRFLNKYHDKYEVFIITRKTSELLDSVYLQHTNDNLILASCCICNRDICPVQLITRDNNMRVIGQKIFNLDVYCFEEDIKKSIYSGYKEIVMSNSDMEEFYNNKDKNIYNSLVNEYLIIKNSDNEVKDKLKWTGTSYQPIKFKSFKSKVFGDIRPLDEIQMCVFDSITHNEITMIHGRAGSGKTTIPLAYILQGLESGKIKKFYIIYHYETLKGAKTLGFERGDHTEKLLNTGSLGGILESKFSDFNYFMNMLGNQIEIIPTCNLRGIEFGSDDAILCTEFQSVDTYTAKTIIQRCKIGCKQIYEGDLLEQSDKMMSVSGMQKMLDVFAGYSGFGCVKLKNNYRSPIGELADRMT